MLDTLQPSVRRRAIRDEREQLPWLEPGDHLDQATFHARYAAMPEDVKAELIGGVVYMPAALRRPHGRSSGLLVHWLRAYEDDTPGVELYDNATTIMGDDSEPQPDACLIVQPECGGQMRVTEDDYLQGAPSWSAKSRPARRLTTCTARNKTTNGPVSENIWSSRCGSTGYSGSSTTMGDSRNKGRTPRASTARECSPACGWTPMP